MTTTEQTELTVEDAAELLYTENQRMASSPLTWALMTANSFNGIDLYQPTPYDALTKETLRFTREDTEAGFEVFVLSRNGICINEAHLSGNLSAETLAAIARALWMDA